MTDVDGSCLKMQRETLSREELMELYSGNPFVFGETEAIPSRDGQRLTWFFYTKCCLLPVERCGCQNWWHRNVLPPMVLQLLCAAAGYQ